MSPVGVPVTGEFLGKPYPVLRNRLLTLGSQPFSVATLLSGAGSAVPINETWFAANCPVAFPFTLNDSLLVTQLGWQNGTSVGDNCDVGIYDTSWNRIVSTGSTACAGAGLLQFVDIADTLLVAGSYYLAKAFDTVTANRCTSHSNNFAVASVLALAGVQDSATTAFPLPDPLTNMAAAATVARMTTVFMATRALV